MTFTNELASYFVFLPHLFKLSWCLPNWIRMRRKVPEYIWSRTTDAQWGNRLHCTAENWLPRPNFKVRPEHILSVTSAQIFMFLWSIPSLGVRSLCHQQSPDSTPSAEVEAEAASTAAIQLIDTEGGYMIKKWPAANHSTLKPHF